MSQRILTFLHNTGTTVLTIDDLEEDAGDADAIVVVPGACGHLLLLDAVHNVHLERVVYTKPQVLAHYAKVKGRQRHVTAWQYASYTCKAHNRHLEGLNLGVMTPKSGDHSYLQ